MNVPIDASPMSSRNADVKREQDFRRVRAGIEYLRNEADSLRLVDYLLFVAMAALTMNVGGVPLNQIVAVLIVLFSFTRRPQFMGGQWNWILVLIAIAMCYLAAVSAFGNGPDVLDWRRRLFRLICITFLAWFLGSGRLHLRSALLGYVTVLVVNVPLFYAGLVSNHYGGYLTGIIGDKNQSGLQYCLVGLMTFYVFRGRVARIATFLFFGGALWLTGSRTSLAAFAFALVWMALGPRLVAPIRWLLGLGVAFGVQYVTANFAESSAFGDRSGTDALRARIDDISWLKTQDAGFFGLGLGNAQVHLDGGETFFFHNSYWTALAEGGWPWLIFVVGITAALLANPFIAKSRMYGNVVLAQGLGIAVLICALRLGEVFFTIPWSLAAGFGLHAFLAILPQNVEDTIHEVSDQNFRREAEYDAL